MTINDETIEAFKEFLQNNGQLSITLFPEGTTKKFKGLKVFYEYMVKEMVFWESINTHRPGKIMQNFTDIVSNIESAINSDNNQKVTYLQHAIKLASANQFPCVYSSTAIGQFIRNRYLINPTQADAACMYFFENSSTVRTRDGFDGLLHSFLLTNNSEVAATTGTNERSALEQLRGSYSEELDKVQHDYQEFKNDLMNWKSQLQKTTDEYLSDKQNSLVELEMLYKEKLRLQSPAQYWDELSKSYEQQGNKWRTWVLVTSGIFILFLSILLYIQPSAYFSINNLLDMNSVKSTIVFALVTSIFVYVISLFVKLSTSAFHLSRDAKERFQLTHVYLSLLNEKGIHESERSIVLQSIFSRADTGLLKGDSSPTIPDSGLTQIFKGMNGK